MSFKGNIIPEFVATEKYTGLMPMMGSRRYARLEPEKTGIEHQKY